ncbi:glycoside hydrolase family 89 protein [Baudoinia panamericana UAMH 10762]|uniref:Glycoside hydrolase family 89 protein n=1 Tax=Baudoinia panamericana (strain UAMH 10762) TaxID=717646 RepID=M2MUZ8_BAUPA|nr:glycoside hydrolase family 89 protein [Baudoinia panamericana UAMH 10762]EMC95408.1 glycoside hydrolase family 89 protein [Baudoinia panamericana UAMH 10762]
MVKKAYISAVFAMLSQAHPSKTCQGHSSYHACSCFGNAQSTAGIQGLVQRRLPNHVNDFTFNLTNSSFVTHATTGISKQNDQFTVSNGVNNTINIAGNSPIALASGLRWYLTNYVHVDIYWYIGSRLHLTPQRLPAINSTYHGSSVVPWRYHFNTVTFSYTAAFWTWEDWELELDWLALRGVNLPLAWVGYEQILMQVFQDAGFSNSDIASFFSGPAFQAWNRFGNIQGSWGGDLPMSWISSQFTLGKQIVARMVELGMTPVLPCFPGFVPMQIGRYYPNAMYINGSQWNGFPRQNTNVSFLEPFDPLYTTLQKSFISKQTAAYGNVSSIYTLDQYNENNPYSADTTYLRNISAGTIAALKAADPNAVWMLQGWLFFSSATFWTDAAIRAYLGGVNNTDMIILDLFSETQPQWQRTNSYYGKPWIWCELHDYGGNMGLYGQVENVTINPIQALNNASSTMVGMGLTMEGQEGNEIMYDILLDQAWSSTPLNNSLYFHDWVTSRYHGAASLPPGLYTAWDTMRQTVYNNTQISTIQSVTKSIWELTPNVTGLLNRTGHHPTTIQYNTSTLVGAWKQFYGAAAQEPTLWDSPGYLFDLTDVTRQVMANAFYPLYTSFVSASNHSANATYSPGNATIYGQQMVSLLSALDSMLAASPIPYFHLSTWIAEARSWSAPTATLPNNATNLTSSSQTASFYEYNARNQITLWGPTGQISDYASKQWAGLISSYYVPRWQLFVNYTLNGTTASNGANAPLAASLLAFEEAWQTQEWGEAYGESFAPPQPAQLQRTIAALVTAWPNVFGS